MKKLKNEYNQAALGDIAAWSRLTLPDQELPSIQDTVHQYFSKPEHINATQKEKFVRNAADLASLYFDRNTSDEDLQKRYSNRLLSLSASAHNDDGTLLFIHNDRDFYGYIRVMPIFNSDWDRYFLHSEITEGAFQPCSRSALEKGRASIFFQAIVFPELKELEHSDKRILQEAGIAGLIGTHLPEQIPSSGINVRFTAFHNYTEKLASRLNIATIGKNTNGCNIYQFNISQNEKEQSLGRQIFMRHQAGMTPFSFSHQNESRELALHHP